MAARESLTVTDNRTGKQYELPIENGAIHTADLRQIKTGADDSGLMGYDPAFTNTATCKSRITYIDGDKGILRYRGYPDRTAGGEEQLPRDRVPDRQGRAARRQTLRRVEAQHHAPHDGAREHQEVHGRAIRYDAHPMGMLVGTIGAHVDVLSGRQAHRRHRVAPTADASADRQAADAGGVCLPPQPRVALRLPGQRAELHRQLPRHAVQDDRAEVQAESGARAGAGDPVHPARRPRAELLDQRHARGRQFAGGSVLGGRRRGRGALRPAARRRQRGGHPHAEGDRLGRAACPTPSRRSRPARGG